jgi:hyperosmotically inducible protein
MRQSIWIVTSALIGALGCSHGQGSATDAPRSSAWQSAKQDFASAYDAVKSGTQQTATAGKYVLKDAGNGVVQVTDKSRQALSRAGGTVADGWITAKVKAELATTKGIKSGDIDASTDHGIVQLRGTVDSPQAAERAIDRALDVKGVAAVDSSLQYPTQTQPPRVYTPEDRPSRQE